MEKETIIVGNGSLNKDEDEKIMSSLTIITQRKVEKLWGLSPQKEAESFPPEVYEKYLEEIAKDKNSFDYFIIYLTGLSMAEMAKIKRNDVVFDFFLYGVNRMFLDSKGAKGYFMIKMERDSLKGKNPFTQDHLKLLPKNWRRANIREASEILLLCHFLEIKSYYEKTWHICQGRVITSGMRQEEYANLARLEAEELIVQSAKMTDTPEEVSSITIKKI